MGISGIEFENVHICAVFIRGNIDQAWKENEQNMIANIIMVDPLTNLTKYSSGSE